MFRSIASPIALVLLSVILGSCGLPQNVVVLLADEEGHVGVVAIDNPAGQVELRKPLAAVGLTKDQAPGQAFLAEQQDVTNAFSAALAAIPSKPATYTLYFPIGAAVLDASSRGTINEALAAAKSTPNVDISIVGHSDAAGSESGNLELSQRRAAAVRDALTASGIAAGVIEIAYFGAADPLVPTAPGTPEPRNRRVEIMIR